MTTARRVTGRARAAPAPKRTRLDVDERKAQLVDLGLRHFGDRPYDEVSIDDIAAAAGISKGLIFHYFDTKKDFYAATVREAARRVLAKTEFDATLPPLDRLRVGLDTYLGYVKGHGKAYVELLRGSGVDPAIAQVVEETRAEFLARLTSGFDQAGGAAAARRGLTRLALRAWVGMVEAASVEWVAHGGVGKEEVRDLLAQALLDTMSHVIARG